MKTSTKVWLGLIVLASVVYGFSIDQGAPRPSAPEYPAGATAEQKADILLAFKIKDADSELVEVKQGGGALTIVYRPRDSHDGDGWTKRVSLSARRALLAIHDTRPDGVPVVIIQAQIPVSTPGGPVTYSNGLFLTYNWNDLQGIDWSRLTQWDAANLPRDISFRRFGLEAALEYCAAGSAVNDTRKFCQRAQAAR